MAVGAGVPSEADQYLLVLAAGRLQRLAVLILHPLQSTLGRGWRHVGVELAQPRAEHARRQADRERQQRRAGEQPSEPQPLLGLGAVQTQKSQQVQPGQPEQHDPGGQKPFAREQVPLHHLVHRAEVLEHRRQNQEAHHHFHPLHPAAALGQPLQIRREQRQEEERRGQAGRERDHPRQRPHSAALNGGGQQSAHEWPHAGERSEREREAHEQRSRDPAALRGAVQAREQARGKPHLESAQQAQRECQKDQRQERVHPHVRTQLHHAERSQHGGCRQAQQREQHHDPQPEQRRVPHAPGARSRRLVQEKRNGDRDHREHAGSEQRRQADPEGHQHEHEQTL